VIQKWSAVDAFGPNQFGACLSIMGSTLYTVLKTDTGTPSLKN